MEREILLPLDPLKVSRSMILSAPYDVYRIKIYHEKECPEYYLKPLKMQNMWKTLKRMINELDFKSIPLNYLLIGDDQQQYLLHYDHKHGGHYFRISLIKEKQTKEWSYPYNEQGIILIPQEEVSRSFSVFLPQNSVSKQILSTEITINGGIDEILQQIYDELKVMCRPIKAQPNEELDHKS